MKWFEYPFGVPFGNPNYDVGLGGSHDATILALPNFPVTALLYGTVSSITAPEWGKQVGIKLDKAYNGVSYMSYLHLSAVPSSLRVGQHVNVGDVIGWVGGGNDQAAYAGTSNPTGQNFLNTPFMSSQIQVGVALMRGPEYGVDAGWTAFPPIDRSLDPTRIILDARISGGGDYQLARMQNEWSSTNTGSSFTSGIARSWISDFRKGAFRGPPLAQEVKGVVYNDIGQPITIQRFAHGVYELNVSTGKYSWQPYS